MDAFKRFFKGDYYEREPRNPNHHRNGHRRQPPPHRSSPPPRDPSPAPKSSLETLMENLNLGPDKIINVLLLGETGVGKSTFINSLANYLEFHQNLEDAETETLQVIIPTSFTAYGKDGVAKLLEVGENHKNENTQEVGASATQKIRTYKFEFSSGMSLSIIDTPGMADTRGIKQDEENCEYILNYISQLKELHAICYLFRPQASRATAHFRYCITQILSRLEKSACENIVFVFTDAKDFTPGETYSILKKMAADIKKSPPFVSIPVENNIFCFDNAPFKYLAATQRGIEYNVEYRRNMKKTWKKSTNECMKLIEYILKLKPHNVRNTAAINECRRVIFQLSQPMAEIAQHIDDNLYMLERHEAQMNIDKSSLEELKDKLYIPVVDLEVKELPQPVTVCTDSKCAEIFMVGERTKWHYKTRCHNPCYLSNVPKDIIGDPALSYCAAITGPGQTCSVCGCHYKVHMHVYYESDTVNKQQVDEIVKENLVSKEEILENARKVIEDTKKRRIQLQAELDVIIQYNAKFAHFVQNNAITPINDSYEDYIKHLIAAENRLGANKDGRKLEGLRQLLREHGQVKQTLQKAEEYQQEMGSAFQSVTPNDIQSCIKEIFKLKINGPTIKKMYDAQNQSRGKEYLDSEYVHRNTFNANKRQNKNKKQKGKGKSNNAYSYKEPSYSQAVRGYPEVPKHEIESDDSDQDENGSQHKSDHSSSKYYKDPRGNYRDIPEMWTAEGHFPDTYDRQDDYREFSRREKGYPDRELREYSDERFGRMGYREYPYTRDDYYREYRERDFYPQRPYGFYGDTPEMWGRYDYYPRDPRQFFEYIPSRDVSAEEPLKIRPNEDGALPKNGTATEESLAKENLPDNATSGKYREEYPPREYLPPPQQFYRDYPNRWRYRDVPENWGQFNDYPQRREAENLNLPQREFSEEFMKSNDTTQELRPRESFGPQDFGPQRHKQSFGHQDSGIQHPRESIGPDSGTQHPRELFCPEGSFYPRDPRHFSYDYQIRGEYPPAPFYRDDMRPRAYPERAARWGVLPQRDPRDYGYSRYPPYYGLYHPAQSRQQQSNYPAATGQPESTVGAHANNLDNNKTVEKPATTIEVVADKSDPTQPAVDIGNPNDTKEPQPVTPAQVTAPEGTKNYTVYSPEGGKEWVVVSDEVKEGADPKPNPEKAESKVSKDVA